MNLRHHKAQMTSIFAGKTPFIVLVSLLAATPLAAQTVLEKAARDETANVADTDPAMAAAMRKAQSTLADFLKVAAAPKPGTLGFSLKVAVREGERVEYFGLLLLPTMAASFPARSIIRRAWFTR